jgi:hypothetical protein
MKRFLLDEIIGRRPANSEKRFLVALILLFLLMGSPARAILVGSSTYNTAAPTGSDIANWSTGWGAIGVTGWDYVGTVNGASGVYLGNNWVLTAAHVGAGNFTLGSTSYAVVGTPQILGTADLTLFQISTAPTLPSLTIATTAPVVFSRTNSGSSVAMIGYGGGHGETWGVNTVTANNLSIQVTAGSPPTTYTSTDFETAYGTTTHGSSSVTNNAQLVLYDSGGGDFVYNSATSNWTLAGINEAANPSSSNPGFYDSYMVQLSSYATQIDAIIAVPEPSVSALAVFALFSMLIIRHFRPAGLSCNPTVQMTRSAPSSPRSGASWLG